MGSFCSGARSPAKAYRSVPVKKNAVNRTMSPIFRWFQEWFPQISNHMLANTVDFLLPEIFSGKVLYFSQACIS